MTIIREIAPNISYKLTSDKSFQFILQIIIREIIPNITLLENL